jgi:hypothetical protein
MGGERSVAIAGTNDQFGPGASLRLPHLNLTEPALRVVSGFVAVYFLYRSYTGAKTALPSLRHPTEHWGPRVKQFKEMTPLSSIRFAPCFISISKDSMQFRIVVRPCGETARAPDRLGQMPKEFTLAAGNSVLWMKSHSGSFQQVSKFLE